MFKRSQLTSKKFVKRKKVFFWIKVTSLVVVLSLLLALLSYLSRHPSVTISAISVQGNSAVSGDEIISLAEGELQGDYFWIFPKKNIFIFPKKTIEEKIEDTWKRVDTVSIERNSWSSLNIVVTEKKAKFLWCGNNISDASSCYYLDENGYIFAKSPIFSSNAYFRFFGNISTSTPVGVNYLPSSDFKNLSSFILEFPSLGFKLSRLLAKSGGEYELYLTDGSRILFNDRQDFSKTFDNLQTLLVSDAYKQDVKKATTPIDYIDIRFGNKLFYKFR